MDNNCFSLSEDQVFLLHVNYLQNQVNDMAVMKCYELNEMLKKSKYYVKTIKSTWNDFFDKLKKFENESKKYCCTDVLAEYADQVEDYIADDVQEFYFAIRRETKRNDPSKGTEEIDLMATCVVALSFIDYAVIRFNDLSKKISSHKFSFYGNNLGLGNVVDSMVMKDRTINMNHLRFDKFQKLFIKFERELFKTMKAKYIDLNESKICMLTFQKFDDKMSSANVQRDMFEKAMGITPLGNENKKEVEVGKPFRAGGGRFIARQHTDINSIKCEKCAFKGRKSCDNYMCDNVYFERYVG